MGLRRGHHILDRDGRRLFLVDHRIHSGLRLTCQSGDQRRFGQIFPIFGRHFRQHGLGFQARWIEDGPIIGLPLRLDRIFLRYIGFGAAGSGCQRLTIPGDARFRRHDQPVHASEPIAEKGGHRQGDMMLRLEPGDETFPPVFIRSDLPETHKGMHFMNVPADRFGQAAEAVHIGIGRILEDPGLALGAVNDAIAQREPLRIAVQQRRLDLPEQFLRYHWLRTAGRGNVVCLPFETGLIVPGMIEQAVSAHLPVHICRWNLRAQKPPCSIAPACNIRLRSERDPDHGREPVLMRQTGPSAWPGGPSVRAACHCPAAHQGASLRR